MNKKIKKITSIIPFLIAPLFFLLIFSNWFNIGILSSGDWIYYYPKSIEEIVPFALWDTRHFGLGGSNLPTLWLESYFSTTVKLAPFFTWALYERLFWHFPIVIFSMSSSYLLCRYVIKNSLFSSLASIIYTFNTYALLVLIGNQLGVGLAYGFAPFTILAAIRFLYDKPTFRRSVILGLLLSILGIFDIRLFYITSFGIGILYIFSISKSTFLRNFGLLLLSFSIVIGIHSFWIFPVLFTSTNPINLVGEEYTGLNSVRFFSFAKLETAMSFLHPNWPDNIFGKVAFQRPEFLFITLLLISSLFYIVKSKLRHLFLGLVGLFLLGAFMSKGTNEPFGEIYMYLFQYLPGFKMFRDPSKWYLLISISLSVLIPYALLSFSKKILLRNVIFLSFLVFWLFTIKEAFVMQKGSLISHQIPMDYERFADRMSMDTSSYRVLWIPRHQRFGYYSHKHPAVNLQELKLTVEDLNRLDDAMLDRLNIRFIVVPIDSDKEIFIEDREYSKEVREKAVNAVQKLGYRKLNEFGQMEVFENPNYKNRVFSEPDGSVALGNSTPISFQVDIRSTSSGTLYLSENYDSGWKLLLANGEKVTSQKSDQINSFTISNYNGKGEIVYEPQMFVYYGLVLSTVIAFGSIGYIFIKR